MKGNPFRSWNGSGKSFARFVPATGWCAHRNAAVVVGHRRLAVNFEWSDLDGSAPCAAATMCVLVILFLRPSSYGGDCDPQFFLHPVSCLSARADAPPQSSCPASPPPSRSPYLHPTQLHTQDPIRLPALPLPPHAHHSYSYPAPAHPHLHPYSSPARQQQPPHPHSRRS
ncbi:hypothetical protein B0H14DRAFT_655670 [Mycena olivaceomarginata]|nr:hypothetical protein B0H14DRAFT_655670 [Mycena olivaceomarginata]